LNRKWTLFIINHSHTDVGYTERQEKIERYHFDFIKQVLAIADPDYKWNIETFWAIDTFNKTATDEEKTQLGRAIREGKIGLSANYLNLSDLSDYDLYKSYVDKAVEYGRKSGIELKSAMMADVNGFSSDYGQALTAGGIENFLSCLHPHHGMYPAYKKPLPVWWELPDESRLLTWHGEHYQIGNDLGFSPDAQMSYSIKDEWQNGDGTLNSDELNIAFNRITAYLENLEKDNFPVSVLPVPVSGLITDNSCPSEAIASRIRELQPLLGENVEIKMSTLDEFFEALREENLDEIITLKGEWPDWWTDGAGSTPGETQLFRNTMRKLEIIRELDRDGEYTDRDILDSAKYNQMLYTEHTWGLSESIRQPGLFECSELLMRKRAYAANGARDAGIILDNILQKKYGDTMLKPGRKLKYKIINPNPFPVLEIAHLTIKYWEMVPLKNGFSLVDGDGKTYKASEVNGPLHFCDGITALIDMEPYEVKEIRIIPEDHQMESAQIMTRSGIDLVEDLASHPDYHDNCFYLENDSLTTDSLKIQWTVDGGIHSMVDLSSGKELVDQSSEYGAFQLIYDTTPMPSLKDNEIVRRSMGRNRRGADFQRSPAKIRSVTLTRDNDLFESYAFHVEIEGCSNSVVNLIFYKNTRRIEVLLDFTKHTTLDPENLYLALPFKAADTGELWLQKDKSSFRPWKDQIDGSLTDFYSIKEGFSHNSENFGIAVATPDTHLLQIGSIDCEQRLLQGNPQLENKSQNSLSWIMNNYWETNFNGNLGGFYNFRYSVSWGEELAEVNECRNYCGAANRGLLVTRCD